MSDSSVQRTAFQIGSKLKFKNLSMSLVILAKCESRWKRQRVVTAVGRHPIDAILYRAQNIRTYDGTTISIENTKCSTFPPGFSQQKNHEFHQI